MLHSRDFNDEAPFPQEIPLASGLAECFPRVAKWLRLDQQSAYLLSFADNQITLVCKRVAGLVKEATKPLRRERRYLPQIETVEARLLPSTFNLLWDEPGVYENHGPLAIEIERTSSTEESETVYLQCRMPQQYTETITG